MDIKTFRAKSMQDALALVRRELGPEASVLHTRELHGGLLGRILFGRKYEVAASRNINVPSRLLARLQEFPQGVESREQGARYVETSLSMQPALNSALDHHVAGQLNRLQEMIEKLCNQPAAMAKHELPETLFHVFTDMIEAEVDESIARSLIDQLRGESGIHVADPLLVKARIAQQLEDDIQVTGPITTSDDKCRLVALVGPTGVGKTTTIAKLAANYRLREKKRVGLITVDTYRVAAVEQLRTYADIIDLPMEVVSTPREMREAVARMQNLDLVLMDTAGRSPRDEIRIQELRLLLAEAEADDVLLVLSATTGTRSLAATAKKFAGVGTTSLILTKLDETTSLGHLVALMRECRLPISYLTDGQNVPDDIQVADRRQLAYLMLGLESQGVGR